MQRSSNAPASADSARRQLLAGVPLSLLVGVGMWIALVVAAGPWNIIANTRLLDVMIQAGIVRLTDADMGIVEQVSDPAYYVASQDSVDWLVVGLVLAIFLLFWVLKGVQFHDIARHNGIRHSFADNMQAYLRGQFAERTLPWGFGEAAATAELSARGVERERIHSTLFLVNAFVLFEIVVFAIYGLLDFGWAAWFSQLFWAFMILLIAYLWSRGSKQERAIRPSFWMAARAHLGALLNSPSRLIRLSFFSLLAFGLEDIAAYFVAQSFTSSNVILNVDFNVLLMGVLGSYIARQVRFTPGGFGQFEWGFATGLYFGGVGLPEAATIAILDNFFRYVSLGIVWIVTRFGPSVRTHFEDVLDVLRGVPIATEITPRLISPIDNEVIGVPQTAAPFVPAPALVWQRVLGVAWLALIYFFDRATVVLADFWMLDSLGLEAVFWTNFRAGTTLFVLTFIGFLAAVAVPAFTNRLTSRQKSLIVQTAVQVGLFAALQMAPRYLTYLPFGGESFGQTDAIFGRDFSFYVFDLPAIELTLTVLLFLTGVLLLSAIICAAIAERNKRHGVKGEIVSHPQRWLVAVSTPTTLVALGLMGVVSGTLVWFNAFNLLYKDNSSSALPTGADILDVVGLFSTVNQIRFSSMVIVGVTLLLILILRGWARGDGRNRANVRVLGYGVVALVGLDLLLAGGVWVRDLIAIRPNEPVIQLRFIQYHLNQTRQAYGIESVELVDFVPRGKDAPLPRAESLLESPVLKNAPLWPSYTSYLEPLLDPQHSERVLQTGGDNMVYGPTLEIFRQQQKLRTYYNFMSVDPLRFDIDGERKVYVSSVRELPLLDPQPWLTWWGQRFLLFTHGYGLVMAPIGEVTESGGPVFASSSIPVETSNEQFAVDNPRIYFGEGSVTMAINNIQGLEEFDFPTEQGRATNVLTEFADSGVAVDSLLKRIVFGWRSGQFFEVVFSDLITPETRFQYYRTPIGRLQRFSPFLYVDSNLYAVPAGDEIVWLANGMTTSDHYPYSKLAVLGDKSVSRQGEAIETLMVNYVEDSVKATVSASTGQPRLYKIADAPIINTWERIYPDMFVDGGLTAMPESIKQQITYPLQLFHIQFDDIYNIYHMRGAEYFFNMEDMWDDGDEVLGPILDEGDSITFSIEPYHVLLETGGVLPESSRGTQFSMAAVFTPENALNLRAVPLVYQDGEDYGRLIALQVPKGTFVMGPEQADAAIDQDPRIAQQISLWNRQGTEVIRGHTSLLIVDGELLYVEPLYIRSAQNPITQLKQVVVVFREQPYMADTLAEAIEMATAANGS